MKAKNKNANLIILAIIGLMLILLLVMQILIVALEQEESNNITVSTGEVKESKTKTVKQIIEDAGSQYIDMTEEVFIKIYANFKYDLYDDKGKSKKSYFEDIIEQIVDLKKASFYLIDNEKNIEIFVKYDKEKDKYTIIINGLDNFYSDTDGSTYVDLSKVEIIRPNNLGITDELYGKLQLKGMYFANSFIVTSEKEDLLNEYYNYPREHVKVKLGGPKVLNIIYDRKYEGEISPGVYVDTKLKDVLEKNPNPGFGSVKEGFLGYRTSSAYIFLYGDEVSIYPYTYKENDYFDQYLTEYCETGNLDKLVSDFTDEWSSYFEFDYDAEKQNLKLTFPARGIAMDIVNNDSKGIKIYNNYCLTETVKNLIKNNKITLEPDKDLILLTEQNRRESMK